LGEKRKALIIIDLLNDFVNEDAPLAVPSINNIIGPIKREIEKARKNNYPVIFLCDCHEEDDREFKLFPPHARKGTVGANVIDELKPEGTDILVRKSSFSGFYDTVLDETLKKLSVGKTVITGTVTNICVLYTAIDALMRGYEVDIVEDAVIGLNELDHKFALDQMRDLFKINIV
jgi:nicotinamidase-related amidase